MRTATMLIIIVAGFCCAGRAEDYEPSQEAIKEARPNIVFAFADDWGRFASAYRTGFRDRTPNAVVHTPNFDRIAADGVLFQNAFVTAPSCTPCRSSLLSGQYFFRTGLGAILQGAIWDPAIPTYPLILRDNGYHIGHSYKVWSPGRPSNAPYGAAATAYNKAGNKFNGFSQFVSRADDAAVATETLLKEVRENFRAFIKDRKKDQPFCYWFGPTNCHRKWVQGSGRRIWGLNPDDLKGKLPPFLPDAPVIREDVCDYLGEIQAFDAGLGALLKELDGTGELENTIVVVSGDHGMPGMPHGKCNLYDFGVAVPLAISWPRKVRPGRIVDDFVNLMDLAPTFVEAAGIEPPDVMTGRSLVGLLQSGAVGQIDPLRDHVVVGRERHVAAARSANLPYPQRAIRTKDFLYIRNFKPDRWPMGTAAGYGQPDGPLPDFEQLRDNTFGAFGDLDASPAKAWMITHRNFKPVQPYFDRGFARRPAEELYDLRSDPHQIRNVAGTVGYTQTQSRLSSWLMEILTEAGDPRVTGDGATFDMPPYTDVFKRPPRRKRAPAAEAKPNRNVNQTVANNQTPPAPAPAGNPVQTGTARRVLLADYEKKLIAIVDPRNNVEWRQPIQQIHDAHLLPNGNILFQKNFRNVIEMTPDKQVVWRYEVPETKRGDPNRIEIHAFQRLPEGRTMIAESGRGRIIELDVNGRILREVKLKRDNPDPHRDTRLVRKLPNGHYLVAHEGDTAVREYAADGKIVWEYDVGFRLYSAERLANGNTLIGCGDGHRVIEVDAGGKVVWSVTEKELPDITLAWITMVERLPNGNTLIVNCHAGPDNPQLIEVTPEKKVVWTFKDFERFGNSLPVARVLTNGK